MGVKTPLEGPAHYITPVSSVYSWVNQTTHSVFTSQGASYDMFQASALIVGKTYTLQCDVKLVGSSSVFVLGIEQGGNNAAQTFTTADGLNTSTYTTLSFSHTQQHNQLVTGILGIWLGIQAHNQH